MNYNDGTKTVKQIKDTSFVSASLWGRVYALPCHYTSPTECPTKMNDAKRVKPNAAKIKLKFWFRTAHEIRHTASIIASIGIALQRASRSPVSHIESQPKKKKKQLPHIFSYHQHVVPDAIACGNLLHAHTMHNAQMRILLTAFNYNRLVYHIKIKLAQKKSPSSLRRMLSLLLALLAS